MRTSSSTFWTPSTTWSSTDSTANTLWSQMKESTWRTCPAWAVTSRRLSLWTTSERTLKSKTPMGLRSRLGWATHMTGSSTWSPASSEGWSMRASRTWGRSSRCSASNTRRSCRGNRQSWRNRQRRYRKEEGLELRQKMYSSRAETKKLRLSYSVECVLDLQYFIQQLFQV